MFFPPLLNLLCVQVKTCRLNTNNKSVSVAATTRVTPSCLPLTSPPPPPPFPCLPIPSLTPPISLPPPGLLFHPTHNYKPFSSLQPCASLSQSTCQSVSPYSLPTSPSVHFYIADNTDQHQGRSTPSRNFVLFYCYIAQKMMT